MNQKMAFGVCIQGIMAENAVENLEKVFISQEQIFIFEPCHSFLPRMNDNLFTRLPNLHVMLYFIAQSVINFAEVVQIPIRVIALYGTKKDQ